MSTPFPPGSDARWRGQTVRVVDPMDRKLLNQHRRQLDNLRLVVAANGQLVWIRFSEMQPIEEQ